MPRRSSIKTPKRKGTEREFTVVAPGVVGQGIGSIWMAHRCQTPNPFFRLARLFAEDVSNA
jgi:hypothetical protein